MILDNIYMDSLSFEPFGFVNWFTLNGSFVNVGPVLFDKFSISLACVVQFFEFEVVISIVLFPFFWDFSTSPEPSSLNNQISFVTINTENTESIFSEVIKISNKSVLQVACEISNFTFSFIKFIVRFPKTPSFRIISSPESIKSGFSIFSINEISLEIVKVEVRFWKRVKRIFLLNLCSQEWMNIFFLFFFFLFLFLLFLWLIFFGLFFLLLFLWFLFLFGSIAEVRDELFLTKPSLSKILSENLVFA